LNFVVVFEVDINLFILFRR